MILCAYTLASTVGVIVQILFAEPGESAHLCSSVIIIITSVFTQLIEHVNDRLHSDSIRDSIRTKISDSQVSNRLSNVKCLEFKYRSSSKIKW